MTRWARSAVGSAPALALSLAACSNQPQSTEPRPSRVAPTPLASASAPVSRSPGPTHLPAITVERPLPGNEVASPVVVAGTADVFEATVSMRIVDANGHVLVRSFTTAICGTGCRGDYRKELRFEVGEPHEGPVEVWWDSPKDGSRQDVVSIPVTLVP